MGNKIVSQSSMAKTKPLHKMPKLLGWKRNIKPNFILFYLIYYNKVEWEESVLETLSGTIVTHAATALMADGIGVHGGPGSETESRGFGV